MEYPDGIGELVLVEDIGSLERRSGYIYLLATLGVFVGFAVMALGAWAAFHFYSDPLSEGGDGLCDIAVIGGFLMFFLPLQTLYDCNKERMAFFTTGIVLLSPQYGNRWDMLHIEWNEMKDYSYIDHWFLGPLLRVDYYGQVLLIPETMEGYDRIGDMVTTNVPPH